MLWEILVLQQPFCAFFQKLFVPLLAALPVKDI